MNNLLDLVQYYGQEAYKPDNIPGQSESAERSWFLKFSGVHLPWGSTQEVVPIRIMQDPKPESMRFWEKAEKEKVIKINNGTYVALPLEGVELHQKYDQESFRYAQLPFFSQFWLFMRGV